MEKKYQVFVSSTFQDLQEERKEVIQALLELDCIPAGMELFQASDDDQWTLIKSVIDECDYYLVIIGGRYGSIGPDGISYTEMEYKYALERNKPIIGFLHKNPGDIPAKNTEKDNYAKDLLEQFRGLVQGKMCKYWTTAAELGGVVSRSVSRLKKTHPAVGWVRADLLPDEDATKEILRLRKKIEELEKERMVVSSSNPPEGTENLAQGDDLTTLSFSYALNLGRLSMDWTKHEDEVKVSWNEIFSQVAPLMIYEASESNLSNEVSALIMTKCAQKLAEQHGREKDKLSNFRVTSDSFQTTKVQLRALGLIEKSEKKRSIKDTATYWRLTSYGDYAMTQLKAIRRS